MRRTIAVLMLVTTMGTAGAARAADAARLAAEACLVCHSPHVHGGIPGIAGRPAGELLKAMLAFRDGSRPSTVMDRFVRGYSGEELGAVAGALAAMDGEGGR